MRHRKAGRKLNRSSSHRLALKRNMAHALFTNDRIVTTVAKAKEMRPFVEKLITLAKRAINATPEKAIHYRRLAISILGPAANADCRTTQRQIDEKRQEDSEKSKESRKRMNKPVPLVKKLFEEIAPRFEGRPGGYTRVIKLQERRLGDGGKTAYLALIDPDEPTARQRREQEEPTAPTSLRVQEDEEETKTTSEAPEEEVTSEQEKAEAEESAEEEKTESEEAASEESASEEAKTETEEKSEDEEKKES